MGFKKGKEKTGGRTKGSQNKLTTTVKDTFTDVFNKLQDNPKVKLEKWGEENPTDFYKLCSKLIPTAIEGKVEGKLTVETLTPEERSKRLKQLKGKLS